MLTYKNFRSFLLASVHIYILYELPIKNHYYSSFLLLIAPHHKVETLIIKTQKKEIITRNWKKEEEKLVIYHFLVLYRMKIDRRIARSAADRNCSFEVLAALFQVDALLKHVV